LLTCLRGRVALRDHPSLSRHITGSDVWP